MLIQKGGISRHINEKRLHEYLAKGYVPLNDTDPLDDSPALPDADPSKEGKTGKTAN